MNFHQATSRSLTSEPLNRGTKMLNRGLQQEAPSLIYSNCCCSVAKLCLTLCDAKDCGMTGFSVLHYLPVNSCPLSQRYHLTISSSVASFSSCLQSFPASWSFPVSQLFASGGQSIGDSASVSVLPMNIQD